MVLNISFFLIFEQDLLCYRIPITHLLSRQKVGLRDNHAQLGFGDNTFLMIDLSDTPSNTVISWTQLLHSKSYSLIKPGKNRLAAGK